MAKNQLKTIWSDAVTDTPHQEYPRPQFQRDSYQNLNGFWDFSITNSGQIPDGFSQKILVPFSPETLLSGVLKAPTKKQFLHYQREFSLSKAFFKGVVLLHFGAVDCVAKVFVNGKLVGEHVGGYNAFEFDISAACQLGKNVLNVVVQDFCDKSYFSTGKQCSHPKGMWYTPQSGIWQTVWLESVSPQYIKSAKLTPMFDQAMLKVCLEKQDVDNVTAIVFDGDVEVAKVDSGEKEFFVQLPQDFKPWTPQTPHLYTLMLVSRRDKVKSYFGMRKFSLKQDKMGFWRTMLNNKPFFHNGLLDQGYWPDGLYTAPTDEAMVADILFAKQLGFNMLRKHIKVEPMRWYYHCDRLGMLVWQDMPSGGSRQKKLFTLYLPFLGLRKMKDCRYGRFSRKNPQSRLMFKHEYRQMIHQLFNCVSIAVWVPFNEGWGQFDSAAIFELTKQLDQTRHVDHASGWHDQGSGDFNSLHVYFKKALLPKDKNRAVVLSEFGGFCYKLKQHSFNPDYSYGYAHFSTKDAFETALLQLFERDVLGNIQHGLTAAVYTQVSDVEDEVNGLVTYDRKVQKIDAEKMAEMNSAINRRFEEVLRENEEVPAEFPNKNSN